MDRIPAAKARFRNGALLLISCLLASFSQASLADGASVFQSKCSGCHTIGNGKLVGPDLAATKTWTDADLEKAIHRMEASVGPLSSDEVSGLLSYLKNPAAGAESKAESSAKTEATLTKIESKAEESEKVGSGSPFEGSQLFDGRRAFINGGMACNACHSVNGAGSGLGPDLGKISEKYSDSALLASCQQTPFKVMKAAYAKHPITKQEALNLVSYFNSLKTQSPAVDKVPVTLCGAGGAVLILLAITFAYRNRNSEVRKKLQRR
ncbi:MAG: c-type cytochrome [Candidatus Obscuribacterales bacterium]|nr:c-type cytochrome [Candidatus Obscuribacterales bacterium]